LSDQSEVVQIGLDTVLARKALLLEVESARHGAVLEGSYPVAKELFLQLKQARRAYAESCLGKPNEGTHEQAGALHAAIMALKLRCDELERELARQVPQVDIQRWMRQADHRAVAASLPADSALVDFVWFRHFQLQGRPGESPWGDARYLVFVILASQPEVIQMRDLGKADDIDALVATFRALIAAGPEDAMEGGNRKADLGDRTSVTAADELGVLLECGKDLYEHLITPLTSILGGTIPPNLFVSPDGALNLLPFDAVPDADGQFLAEKDATITYLSGGRELLAFTQTPLSTTDPLIVADPDFWLGARDPDPNPGNHRWRRLPGTMREAQVVDSALARGGYDDVELWLARKALEGPLKSVRAPRLLHLATHAFFLEDPERQPADFLSDQIFSSHYGDQLRADTRLTEDPLVRSGVGLAGAKAHEEGWPLPAEAEDGVLLASDVLGMNLHGTELVVLSCCDTGNGAIRCGEGVYGLRRVFQIAGARSLVMSLWKVPDAQTAALMGAFYEHLAVEGKGKAQSLREAQRSIRHANRHPFFWAAFICQGDPAPLQRANVPSMSLMDTPQVTPPITTSPVARSTTETVSRPSLEAELLAAAAQSVPDNWQSTAARFGEHRFTLRFPPTWLEGSSPEGPSHYLIHPVSARLVHESGRPLISPGVMVLAGASGELQDDAFLDRFLDTRGQGFQGFRIREYAKTRLHGTRALCVWHDFTVGGKDWTCISVLLVIGKAIWYADASGLATDVSSMRAQMMGILATIRIDPQIPRPLQLQALPEGNEYVVLSGTSEDMEPMMRQGVVLNTLPYHGRPREPFYEGMSRDLLRKHGPLVGVDFVSDWPKFEIWFRYKDGTGIYSGHRTGQYDIHFLSLGYVGDGPRLSRHFLAAAGFDLTSAQIESIRPGDSIATKDGTAVIVRAHEKVVDTNEVTFTREEKRIEAGFPATYRYYKGASKAVALAFLDKQDITAQSFFVAVETPEGMFCKDRIGLFEP
jgi:CHAT domain-containing protein